MGRGEREIGKPFDEWGWAVKVEEGEDEQIMGNNATRYECEVVLWRWVMKKEKIELLTGVIMGCLLDDLKALWVDNNGWGFDARERGRGRADRRFVDKGSCILLFRCDSTWMRVLIYW